MRFPSQVLYLVCVAAVVVFTMQKRFLLRVFTRVTPGWFKCLHRKLAVDIARAQAESVVFFCKTYGCGYHVVPTFTPHRTKCNYFCDRSVREKAWRSHKRVAQAT